MELGLKGKRVAFLATDGVEQSELEEPRKALQGAGATTVLVSIEPGEIQAMKHDDKSRKFTVDLTVDQAHATDFDALVLPGGVANPDRLRTNDKAVQFVREFMLGDKPVAAICHGPWMLVEADGVAGRKLTSWPSLKTDIRNAGGEWVDSPVQVDGRLVTSRKPADIPAFNDQVLRVFGRAIDERKADELSEQSFPASDAPPGPSSIGGTGHLRNDPDTRP